MPYQRKALESIARYLLVNKSRRIGFSEAMAARAAMRALGLALRDGRLVRERNKGVPQNLFSASKLQAQDLLQRVLRYVRLFGKAFPGKVVLRETATMAVLRGGVRLRALASSPRSARGWEGDCRFDEFANVVEQEALWAAAEPLARPTLGNPEGFEVWVVSTPLGDDNLFFEMACGRMAARFEQHSISIHDAAAQGFPILVSDHAGGLRPGTVDELRAEFMDDVIFAQEFECSFMSSSARFIDAEVYDSATWDADKDPLPVPEEDRPATYYGGIDLARSRDRTAFVKLREYARTMFHTLTDTVRDRSWAEQEAWWDAHFADCHRVCVDSTTIGSAPSERMQLTHGSFKVEPVDFTLQAKERLATGLKLGLQTRRLRPLRSDHELRREVLSLRREQLPGGGVRYAAPRQGGGHGDRAWALALAYQAAGSIPTSYPRVTTYTNGDVRRPVERLSLLESRRLMA